MWRVGNARRWLVEKTNLPAGHPARSWTVLKAALCVFCLTWERHGEGELAMPLLILPDVGSEIQADLAPVANGPRGGPRRSLCQASRQVQQIKPMFKAIPVMHRWMAEPAGLDVGSSRAGCGLPHACQGDFRFSSVLLGCHQETCGPLGRLLASSYHRCQQALLVGINQTVTLALFPQWAMLR